MYLVGAYDDFDIMRDMKNTLLKHPRVPLLLTKKSTVPRCKPDPILSENDHD